MAVKWSEVRTKVLSTVTAAVLIAAGAWAWNWGSANIVLASDLEGLADMIGKSVRDELKPLEQAIQETNELAQANAADIKAGRVDATRQAIRDLKKEIQDMEARKAAGQDWTRSDELLLDEWRKDLEQLNESLAALEGSQ